MCKPKLNGNDRIALYKSFNLSFLGGLVFFMKTSSLTVDS